MKVDASLTGIGTREAAAAAADWERRGMDGVWATESVTDGLLMAMGAVLATSRVDVGTAVAVAFARNPMSVAYATWDLASSSGGRFTLGLGTQVRAHVERRFAMPWSDPAARMRDFIGALRAIWSCWQEGRALDYDGDVYRHTLMSPMFTPAHHDHALRVGVSAVGPRMTELVGEACDELIAHCFITPAYFDSIVEPRLAAGAARAGRTDPVTVYCPLMLLIADTDEKAEAGRERARSQLAFYGSTREYRGVLASIGYEALHPELLALSRAGRWSDMTRLVDDVLLDAIAVSGTPETIAGALAGRWGGRLDRISSILGWPDLEPDRLGAMLAELAAVEGRSPLATQEVR